MGFQTDGEDVIEFIEEILPEEARDVLGSIVTPLVTYEHMADAIDSELSSLGEYAEEDEIRWAVRRAVRSFYHYDDTAYSLCLYDDEEEQEDE